MNFWAAFPFIRYLICLISGILTALYLPWPSALLWPIVALIAAFNFFLYFFRLGKPVYKTLSGIMGCALLLTAGFALTMETLWQDKMQLLPHEPAHWLVEAERDGVKTPKTLKVQAKIIARLSPDGWVAERGKSMLYLKGVDTARFIPEGSHIIIKARLNEIPEPLNPGSFNYKGYLAGKGINYQSFVDSANFRLVKIPKRNLIREVASYLRNHASASLDKHIEGKQEVDIVKAMVLGIRDNLDEDILQSYATAGVMHILAVSGLHVGIIYGFLIYFLHFWRRSPTGRWLSFVIVLIVLWTYAIVAGLSPSITRAAFMFSMLDLALKMKRKSNIYNTLAVAAFVLLIINPYNLKAVGFQLSFLAVAGIVYITPKLSSWYKGNNWLGKKVWDLLSVSAAAQIATFPLGLYYFGQFPSYFFLANLIVVPAAGIILGSGFVLLFLSMLSNTLAGLAGYGLESLMKGVNAFVLFVESLPLSRLNGQIDVFQLFLIYGITISFFLLIRFKTFRLSLPLFFCSAFLVIDLYGKSYRIREQKKLIVYHISGHSAVQIVNGKHDILLADENLPEDQIKFQVEPNRKNLGMAPLEGGLSGSQDFRPPLIDKENFSIGIWRGLRIVWVKEALPDYNPETPLKADFVILSKNAVTDLNELSKIFEPAALIIDGSNSYYLMKRLKKQAAELNIIHHITAEKGAFEWEIE